MCDGGGLRRQGTQGVGILEEYVELVAVHRLGALTPS